MIYHKPAGRYSGRKVAFRKAVSEKRYVSERRQIAPKYHFSGMRAPKPPEEAFALSDASIRHIEQLRQQEEVLLFEKKLLLQFIHLVRQKQNREHTTPIRRALHYIDTHLDARLMLGDVAQYAGVHPNYLSRRFREKMGKTVGGYANERKIMESVCFVQRQGYAMADIASLYAFSSQSYFISSFKKLWD